MDDAAHLTQTENPLAEILPVVEAAKYFGSSNADAAYLYFQAAGTFRCVVPVLTRSQIHPKRNAQIVMAILMDGLVR